MSSILIEVICIKAFSKPLISGCLAHWIVLQVEVPCMWGVIPIELKRLLAPIQQVSGHSVTPDTQQTVAIAHRSLHHLAKESTMR